MACAVIALTAMPAHAQNSGATIEQRLEALERRNAELEQEVRELKSRIDAQPSETGELASSDRPTPAVTDVSDASLTFVPPVEEARAEQWRVGLNPNGGGFFARSPKNDVELRLLGYVQAQGTLTDEANDLSFEHGDFRVRRARVDLIVDLFDSYELFLEFEGAATGGTALRIARINAEILDERFQLRAGKFITPFSSANRRSLDTIERYIALNSMFSLPALDTQVGAMLWGTVPMGSPQPGGEASEPFQPNLTYSIGAWNGSNSGGAETVGGIGGNARDANGGKEVQLKLEYEPTRDLNLGLGFDYNDAATESLTLSSLSGTPYINVLVPGTRYGVSADFEWRPGRFSLRGEGLYFEFDDADSRLYGGFLQAAYFVAGDSTGGVQPLLRGEYAALDGAALSGIDGDSIVALTAGVNWFINGNIRVQLNYIGEYFDGDGNVVAGSDGFRNTLLSQLQFKF